MPERDLELLSAYLDNALTRDEQAQVEARLAAEPEFARELERLRLTSALIGTLPMLQTPRPLTVTRAMVAGASPRVPLFPATVAFSAISAAAAIIVLLAGVILLSTARDSNTASVAFAATTAVQVAATNPATIEIFSAAEATQGDMDMLLQPYATTMGGDEAMDSAQAVTVSPAALTQNTRQGDMAGGAAAPLPEGSSMPTEIALAESEAMEEAAADAGMLRAAESPTPMGTQPLAPAAAMVITMTAPPLPTTTASELKIETPVPTPTITETKAPTITLSPTPFPSMTPTASPVPPIDDQVIQAGDGSSIGAALIVIAALLFLLSATAFMRRRSSQ